MVSFMQVKYVIHLRKQLTWMWKRLEKQLVKYKGKTTKQIKNIANILRERNKYTKFAAVSLALERDGCIFSQNASLAQLARARDL